nr:helix-turn-helix transcriptional regulator [Kibdelosporangium sp. MJ126-NF4]CEL13551.1 Putative DNA-binding protein in cluster with Type I restriction-modification system [Kibdelosporangium sp. MJ126-NF4]CTQ99237.1 Putative DNA-binding protein in cluster with Type I restriction-modification system [Kibdelosporangium sp. MJ126-NF4]
MPRRRLGIKLRRMRERAKFTLEAAAPELDKTRSALQRIEAGETKADVHLVRSMMDLYDLHDPLLLDEARKALKSPWYQAHGVKARYYVDVETEAASACDFSALMIPELLRTEEYTSALLKSWDHPSPHQEVTIQQVRQQRLTDSTGPLNLVAVMDEAVLRRRVGGSETMRSQLQHLISAAALPTVDLHVLPLNGGACCPTSGTFTLLTRPETSGPDVLHFGQMIGGRVIENQHKIKDAVVIFEYLQRMALGTAATVELIQHIAAEVS